MNDNFENERTTCFLTVEKNEQMGRSQTMNERNEKNRTCQSISRGSALVSNPWRLIKRKFTGQA